jgi:DNA-binding CsgD family transcriptional regulator
MDQIDANLFEAWQRIAAICRADPDEARRRWRRTLSPTLTRPPRAWCLVIRASDSRIGPWPVWVGRFGGTGVSPVLEGRPGGPGILPGREDEGEDDHSHGQDARATGSCATSADTCANSADIIPGAAIEFDPDARLGIDESIEAALKRGVPHSITLDGRLIRALCRPVAIPWPGMPLSAAARRLGVGEKILHGWVRRGVLDVRREPCRVVYGKRGPEVPVVWSPGPLDPNAKLGRAPAAIWGEMWQTMHERLPENYEITVQRIARQRAGGGRIGVPHSGWDWICPGRRMPDGTVRECGRRAACLYGPLPVWTIADALGIEEGFEIGESRHEPCAMSHEEKRDGPPHGASLMAHGYSIAGAWHPGYDPLAGRRSFACRDCWAVRDGAMINAKGWCEFVGHISGGLLYGHEVERPPAEAPMVRQRRFVNRRRTAARRDEVLAGIVAGRSYADIAAGMGVQRETVRGYAWRLFMKHGVHGREELRRKFESERERAGAARGHSA